MLQPEGKNFKINFQNVQKLRSHNLVCERHCFTIFRGGFHIEAHACKSRAVYVKCKANATTALHATCYAMSSHCLLPGICHRNQYSSFKHFELHFITISLKCIRMSFLCLVFLFFCSKWRRKKHAISISPDLCIVMQLYFTAL